MCVLCSVHVCVMFGSVQNIIYLGAVPHVAVIINKFSLDHGWANKNWSLAGIDVHVSHMHVVTPVYISMHTTHYTACTV